MEFFDYLKNMFSGEVSGRIVIGLLIGFIAISIIFMILFIVALSKNKELKHASARGDELFKKYSESLKDTEVADKAAKNYCDLYGKCKSDLSLRELENEGLKKNNEGLLSEKTSWLKDNATLKEDNSELTAKLKTATDSSNSLLKENDAWKKDNELLKKDNSELSERVAVLTESLSNKNEIAKLNAKNDELDAALAEKRNSLAKSISDLSKDISNLKEEKSTYLKKLNTISKINSDIAAKPIPEEKKPTEEVTSDGDTSMESLLSMHKHELMTIASSLGMTGWAHYSKQELAQAIFDNNSKKASEIKETK